MTGDNAYQVSLGDELHMNSVFNVNDLSPFHGDNVLPIALPYDPSLNAPTATDKVDIVIDNKASKDSKIIDRYHIKWRSQPKSESCWIISVTL